MSIIPSSNKCSMQICIILRLLPLLGEHIHIAFFDSSGWNPSGFLQNAGQFIYIGDWWIFDRRQVIHLYFSIRTCECEWFEINIYIWSHNHCFQEIFEDWNWEASSCSWELPRSFLFNIPSCFLRASSQQAQPILPSQPHCGSFPGGTGLVAL